MSRPLGWRCMYCSLSGCPPGARVCSRPSLSCPQPSAHCPSHHTAPARVVPTIALLCRLNTGCQSLRVCERVLGNTSAKAGRTLAGRAGQEFGSTGQAWDAGARESQEGWRRGGRCLAPGPSRSEGWEPGGIHVHACVSLLARELLLEERLHQQHLLAARLVACGGGVVRGWARPAGDRRYPGCCTGSAALHGTAASWGAPPRLERQRSTAGQALSLEEPHPPMNWKAWKRTSTPAASSSSALPAVTQRARPGRARGRLAGQCARGRLHCQHSTAPATTQPAATDLRLPN